MLVLIDFFLKRLQKKVDASKKPLQRTEISKKLASAFSQESAQKKTKIIPKILRIYKNDDPILRTKCREIESIEPWVMKLCADMWATMKAKSGCGLAANQVGYDYRIIAVSGADFKGVMINPIIEEASKEKYHFVEGCLSIPGVAFDTGKRSKNILTSYTDLGGNRQKVWTQDMTSVIIQHEMDHLDGILMIDHFDNRMK